MSYQGWKNYETFSMALFIDNDRNYYETALSTVQEAIRGVRGARKRWDESGITEAKLATADALKEWFEEEMPELEGPWSSLLNSAFEEIDWIELAEHYMETLRE